MRVANLVMACLFALFTALQFNDPDRWLWLAIYGYATLACVAWARGILPALAPIGLALYTALAACWYPGSLQGGLASEPVRETLGLVICAVWMGVDTVAWMRAAQPATGESA